MKLIIITDPEAIHNEIPVINKLFENGLDYLHLRKPDYSRDDLKIYLNSVKPEFIHRIIIHDHYDLINEFNIKGIHLNGRNINNIPTGIKPFSSSCHTIDEVKSFKNNIQGYLFLSPIFDSISKKGYKSSFDVGSLKQLNIDKVIDDNVVALGGINLENIQIIKELGFGGIAILGALWNDYKIDNNEKNLLDKFRLFKQNTEQ